jgi:hypothetical protein
MTLTRRSAVRPLVALATVLLAGAVTGCSASPEPISYQPSYPSHDDVAALMEDSTSVFVGVVTDSQGEWIDLSDAPDSQMLYTVYSVQVAGGIVGDVQAGSTGEVRQLGGTVGDQTAVASGAAALTDGNAYVMFVQEMPDGALAFPYPAESVFDVDKQGTVTAPAANPLGADGAAQVAAMLRGTGG